VVVILHDKTPYGQGLADETKKAMNAAGLNEAFYEGIETGTNDFSALISRIKQANADVVYFGGLHTEAGKIVRQMADAGIKPQFISGDGIVSDEFVSIAGPAAEGVMNTFGPDPRSNPDAQAVVEKFRAAGFEPEAYTLYSYAVMQVLAQAIEKTGSAEDPMAVAETIKSSGPWTTVLGELGYDEKGDITKLDYVMYRWEKQDDGKITYVQMADAM
jgi:branched-chain amino acid transport system substrate-binding protein